MYPAINEVQIDSIKSDLRTLSEDFYLHDGVMCQLFTVLKDAIYLDNKEGLAAFKGDVMPLIEKLNESNLNK